MDDSANQESLERRLRQAEAAKAGSYDKRTEHLNADGTGIFINRLILEDSPYLLQHAHNPVNWYPWSAEAFATAEAENKPIFLSIGYSTCHWCHVMEVESFDNAEVAKLLNQHFISIKLDREQYPDIDEIYMTGVQLMSGQGGWPMSNFLLPDGRPFFAATYFPAPTFMQLLEQIVSAWKEKYEELEQSAASVDAAIKRLLEEHKQAASLDSEIDSQCVTALLKREDRQLGGLAGSPKFPQEPLLLYLLDQAQRRDVDEARAFVRRALHGMAEGGIYDQVGGGFHRYSVDAYWLVPHFEKMLYNQSQLALVYLQAWRLDRDPFFRRIVEQTLAYVCRDMQHPDGGFYSATDADSEGSEGTFFLWTPEQLQEVLSDSGYQLIRELFGVTNEGNFEGATILNLQSPLAEAAKQRGGEAFYRELDRLLGKLYEAREQRIHPLRDDKLIVAWNGTMIHALALAAHEWRNQEWLAAAERAAATLCRHNLNEQGELRRICLDGTVSIAGQLEDYGNFANALITLHDVTVNSDYLNRAAQIMNYCLQAFWDEDQACFFLSPAQQEGPRLSRSRSAADGATLAPVATVLMCLQRLRERAALLEDNPGELYYQGIIDKALAGLQGAINDNPLAHSSLLRVSHRVNEGAVDVVQFAGGGLARVTSRRSEEGLEEGAVQFSITLTLAPGWHIAAADQDVEEVLPLSLELADNQPEWQLGKWQAPAPAKRLQADKSESFKTHEGEVTLSGSAQRLKLDAERGLGLKLGLTLQLCNEQQCLLPETLILLV